jgi:hypothetical protein
MRPQDARIIRVTQRRDKCVGSDAAVRGVKVVYDVIAA